MTAGYALRQGVEVGLILPHWQHCSGGFVAGVPGSLVSGSTTNNFVDFLENLSYLSETVVVRRRTGSVLIRGVNFSGVGG